MMRSTTKNKSPKRLAYAAFAAVFWLAVWQAAAMLADNVLIVAPPAEVIVRLFRLCAEPSFWLTVSMTMLRLAVGFSVGTAAGVILAAASYRFEIVNAVISPFMNIVRAMPVASFIMFLLVWSKNEYIPVISAVIMVVPIVWGNVIEGIGQTDKKLLQMASVFRLSQTKILRHIYIPSVMPYFISAVITSVGLAWKAAVAAEVLCQPHNSIGKMLQGAKIYLETTDLFAWTLAVIIISIIIEKLLKTALGRFEQKGRAVKKYEN